MVQEAVVQDYTEHEEAGLLRMQGKQEHRKEMDLETRVLAEVQVLARHKDSIDSQKEPWRHLEQVAFLP
jgi:hypothetical protein